MTPNKTLATYWFNKYIKFIIYSVALRIQPNAGKFEPEKTPYLYTFILSTQ